MTHYPSYPIHPAGQGNAAPARPPRPSAVETAVKLIWANIALSLVGAVVTFAMLDSLVDQQLDVAAAGVDADTLRSGLIVGVAVGLAISVAVFAMLAYFIGKGANWARLTYTVLSVLGFLLSLVGIGDQPVLFLLLSVLSLALTVWALLLLWQQESSAWFKAR